jgi:hypothetical protein
LPPLLACDECRSERAENHAHAVALSFLSRNLIKAPGTLPKVAGVKTSSATAADLTDHVWTAEEIVARMDPKRLTVKQTQYAPATYPSTDELARLEIQKDLGRASALWDEVWTEIKSA